MNAIWSEILADLQKEVNGQAFATWIKPLDAVKVENDVVFVSVPNKFFLGWLMENGYAPMIEKAVSGRFGEGFRTEFVVSRRDAAHLPSSQSSSPEKPAPDTDWKERSVRIGLNPRHTFESFVVGPSNEFAHAACKAVAGGLYHNYNPLFIYGGVGLGKTHLLNAIGNQKLMENPQLKICFVTSESFTNELIQALTNDRMGEFRAKYRSMDVLLVDDIQFLRKKERTQEEFFHTFNALYERQKSIVLSSDKFPKEIPEIEDRLRSRFEWGLIADIQPPDTETKVAILHKKAALESIELPGDVAMFLATRISSNIRELEGSLTRVAAFSNLTHTKITIELAKRVLSSNHQNMESNISVDDIVKAVSSHYKVKIADIKGKKRTRLIAWARQVSMFLARDMTDSSFPEIGMRIGGKDHSTVMYACEKVGEYMNSDADIARQVNLIKSSLAK
ncbi:chromosomal replication initiator protein DnaA [bacterium]|nr:MAG: chromosomal replication initiator protein DnaA [bacterium]